MRFDLLDKKSILLNWVHMFFMRFLFFIYAHFGVSIVHRLLQSYFLWWSHLPTVWDIWKIDCLDKKRWTLPWFLCRANSEASWDHPCVGLIFIQGSRLSHNSAQKLCHKWFQNVPQLLPTTQEQYGDDSCIGAPCHKARGIMNWLGDHNFDILDPWPGNSQDLNPIKSLWSILKWRLDKQKSTNCDKMCHHHSWFVPEVDIQHAKRYCKYFAFFFVKKKDFKTDEIQIIDFQYTLESCVK